MVEKSPVVVVLAAGKGSRFTEQGHKLVQPLGGSTVLGNCLAHVLNARLPLVVVTTKSMAEQAARFVAQRDLLVLSDAEAARGVGFTIAAGVAAHVDASGWLVLPADMPLVKSATIQSVAQALAHYPVVVAQYQGRRGHPVGFSAELLPELLELTGDEGARRVVARYPAHAVNVDDPGVLFDIDTPEQLAQARQMILPKSALSNN